MPRIPPFHLAIPVNNIQESMRFYGQLLKCQEGRRCAKGKWVDYNFYGHQLVCHFTYPDFKPHDYFNPVDGDHVPVPHFGLCLDVEEWKKIRDILIQAKIKFIVEPHLRFPGEPGEQYTMFFKDPTGNNVQLKAMSIPENLFAKYEVQ